MKTTLSSFCLACTIIGLFFLFFRKTVLSHHSLEGFSEAVVFQTLSDLASSSGAYVNRETK